MGLETETEALAAIGLVGRESGDLLYTREPVADGVAMQAHRLGRLSGGAVVGQERLERRRAARCRGSRRSARARRSCAPGAGRARRDCAAAPRSAAGRCPPGSAAAPWGRVGARAGPRLRGGRRRSPPVRDGRSSRRAWAPALRSSSSSVPAGPSPSPTSGTSAPMRPSPSSATIPSWSVAAQSKLPGTRSGSTAQIAIAPCERSCPKRRAPVSSVSASD